MPLAVVPLNDCPARYHKEAEALLKSEFLNTYELYPMIGKDNDYQIWCRGLNKCAYSGRPANGGDRMEYAHYRSIAKGAGTGVKSNYTGIPMLHSNHHIQTNEGYSGVGGKDWFRDKSEAYVKQWASENLLKKLKYMTWSQVPPEVLFCWADDMDIENHLPKEYLPKDYKPKEYRG